MRFDRLQAVGDTLSELSCSYGGFGVIKKSNEIIGLESILELAETSEGIKIIEYNCWSASGAYDCDLVETFKAITKCLNKNMI